MKFGVLFSLIVMLAACSAREPQTAFPPPPPLPDSVIWNADAELAPMLRRSAFGVYQLNLSEELAVSLGPEELDRRLGLIAEDTTNPAVVRINALEVLTHRKAVGQLLAFSQALKSREERVRMAAVSGMRTFLPLAEATALAILDRALHDPNPRIQARVLEIITDRDIEALRQFLPRAANPELRGVAQDLIRVGEGRGGALQPIDSLGTLERVTESGITIRFRPTRTWPDWNAAAGELAVALPGQQPVVVATNIEVVGNVIPAFTVGDSALVYEVNREIRLRSLRDQSERTLGPGIAPRIMPFTSDIIYFREVTERRQVTPTEVPYRYQVIRVPAAGGAESILGEVRATAKNDVKGNYSPVRWSRIRELNGVFFIVGDTMGSFQLPDPFGR